MAEAMKSALAGGGAGLVKKGGNDLSRGGAARTEPATFFQAPPWWDCSATESLYGTTGTCASPGPTATCCSRRKALTKKKCIPWADFCQRAVAFGTLKY